MRVKSFIGRVQTSRIFETLGIKLSGGERRRTEIARALA